MSRRALSTVIAALLVLTACGAIDDQAVESVEAEQVPIARTNEAVLEFTDELATTQMLDVRTGEIQSLDDQVTGDRAIVLWYWAPD